MKKHRQTKPTRLKWLWVLLIQIIGTLAFSALISLSVWLGGFGHGICLWAVMPIGGFISAYMATRRGLLNYVSWIIPPAAQVFANLLLWGYSPSVGPVFLCAFISLVGAAAGEVRKRQSRR